MKSIQNKQAYRDRKWLPRAEGGGGGGTGEMGVTASGYRVSFGMVTNVLKLMVPTVAQRCEYTKNHWIVQFKFLNCMACELYIKKADFFLKGTAIRSLENNEFRDWSKEENQGGEASP